MENKFEILKVTSPSEENSTNPTRLLVFISSSIQVQVLTSLFAHYSLSASFQLRL
jgi:hypothetical protein